MLKVSIREKDNKSTACRVESTDELENVLIESKSVWASDTFRVKNNVNNFVKKFMGRVLKFQIKNKIFILLFEIPFL